MTEQRLDTALSVLTALPEYLDYQNKRPCYEINYPSCSQNYSG